MQLQQSGFSGFGYSPSASTAASGSHSGGTSQATARKLLLGSVWSALGLSGPTGGVQDIASALSSALSTGLASGQDLAPQLTQTVDNALDQVSQQLEAQGVSPDHVAKLVARFRQDLANAVNSAAAAAANGGPATSVNAAATNGSASSATTGVSASSSANTATSPAATTGTSASSSANTAASPTATTGTSASSSANTAASPTATTGASTSSSATATAGVSASSSSANSLASSLSELATVRESETLTIQTTDGAQVTLRFRAQGAELGTSQTQSDGSTSTAGALFASSKFQVEVSGNLSSADLTAINNVVSQVNSLATQFFSGDVQDAFAAAASIGADPSEIAGFSLQMSYSATLYQQASTAANPSTTNTVAPVVTNPTTTGQAGGATSTPYVIKTPSNWHAWRGPPATSTLPTSLANALNAAVVNAAAAATTGTTATGPGSSAGGATASAANAAATASSNATSNATAPAGATNASTTAAAANTSGAATATTTSTPAGTTPAAATATPQQIIANFLQNALAKLGGSSNGSGTTLSARWGIQLLAVALPAYAQAQTAAGSQATPTSPPSAAAGNSSPAVTQVAVTAPTQAAHLAAATLIQLIN